MLLQREALSESDDIEAFFINATGMQPGFIQLSRGPANLQLDTVSLDGVTLVWCRSQGQHRWRDTMTGSNLHLAIAVESDEKILFHGHEVDRDEVAIWFPHNEMDFIMRGPLLTLDIGIDANLVDELGWRFRGEPMMSVKTGAANRLLAACSKATRAANLCRLLETSKRSNGIELALRDQILDALDAVLQPWTKCVASQPTRTIPAEFRILSKAEAVFDISNSDYPIDIDRLAERVGTSRRSVFRAFQNTLGIGPRRYFELKRLYTMRSRLRRAHRDEVSVTDVATDLGFFQLGHLAKLYRLQFGETPSETLRQSFASQ